MLNRLSRYVRCERIRSERALCRHHAQVWKLGGDLDDNAILRELSELRKPSGSLEAFWKISLAHGD